MSDQRIKGQETTILLTRAGVLENTLTEIMNFNFEVDLEIKKQGFLGEKTDRRDEVYNGVKFDFELQIKSTEYFTFQQAILSRAKRDTPDVVFNITQVYNFPNGETFVVTLLDVKFGAIPTNIPARADYVKIKMQGECDDFDAVAA